MEDDNVTLNIEMSLAPNNYDHSFDLVANDCNTTENPQPLEDCNEFDIIIADYYVNPNRAVRVDFSPAWLRTSMSTVKYVGGGEGDSDDADYTTLTEATNANAPVCLPDGTYLQQVVMNRYPNGNFIACQGPDDCINNYLKLNKCVLFSEDELQLRYRSVNDPTLQVTKESFNTQYLVWAINQRTMSPNTRKLLSKYIISAISNEVCDQLYYEYFQNKICPIGTSGSNCTDPCHPKYGQSNELG